MAEVLRSPFVTPERLAELRGMGVEISERPPIDTLDLPAPAYGEEVVGELTPEETMLLAALMRKVEAREELSKRMSGKMLIKVGQHVAHDAERPTDPFDDEDEARAFYRLHKECEVLHANLYFGIAERFGTHHYTMAIRSRGRIVKLKRLY